MRVLRRSSWKKLGAASTGASSRKILAELMNSAQQAASALDGDYAGQAPTPAARPLVETRTRGISTSTTMTDLDDGEAAKEALQQAVSTLEGEKASIGEQLEQMNKRKADWEAEGVESVKAARGEAETAKAELAIARAAEAKAREETELQMQKAQAVEAELQAARDGMTGSDEQVSAAQAQADELRKELDAATAGRAELEQQLAVTKAEMEAAKQALETQRAAVECSSNLEQGLQQQMEEAKVEMETLRRESTSESQAASEAQARIEAMTMELTAESERHVAATERLTAMTADAAAAEAAHAESQAALTAQLEAESTARSQTESKLEHAEKALVQATQVTVAQAAHVRALAVVGQGMAANPIEDPSMPDAIRSILEPEEGDAATAAMAIDGDVDMVPPTGAPLVSSQQQLMTDVQSMAMAVNQLREALEEQQAQNGMLVTNNAKLQKAADAAEAAEAAAAMAAEGQRAAEARALAAEETSAKVQERLGTEERLRVHLHNLIQQLKGNIRVCVRVRPMIGDEAAKAVECDDKDQLSFPDDLSVEVSRAQATVTKTVARKNLFTYDKTFNGESSQEAVFGEVSEFVQSAIDGKRVCVFCYGITGSGKTYTMGTDVGDLSSSVTNDGAMPENAGIVPRTIKLLMDTLATDQSAEVTTTCLEVYNEQVRDLFGDKKKTQPKKKQTQARECAMPGMRNGPAKGAAGLAAKKKKDDEEHKVDPKTGEVSNLVAHSFSSSERVALCAKLEGALSGRSVSATNCNEESSRAHTVLTIKVKRKTEHGTVVDGELNLVDLAGSERIALSGVTGDRQKETQAINASLSALGDVVASMHSSGKSSAGRHVPYRNSKLTHVLQKCLGSADAKILMFINVSPFPGTLDETTNSLRFASKVYAAQSGGGAAGGGGGGGAGAGGEKQLKKTLSG